MRRSKGAPAGHGANPFKRLVYVYVGTSNFEGDLDFYENKLGARLLWNLKAFGPESRPSTSAESPTCFLPTT